MLKYVGDGSFIPGIPARDLQEEEIEKLKQLIPGSKYLRDQLLKSNLYVEAKITGPAEHQATVRSGRERK